MTLEGKIFLFFIIILNIKSSVFARCSLKLSENPALRPNILLTIGSHQVDFPINEADNNLMFFEDQEIELICNSKFEYPTHFTDNQKIRLLCTQYNNLCLPGGSCFSDYTFECSSQKWNLYESTRNFVWCPKNTSSYIVVRPVTTETMPFEYLAGVCYDTHNLSFKSLYYTISSKRFQHLSPPVLSDLYSIDLEVTHIKEALGNKNVFETDYNNEAIRNWIHFAKYNYSSIIQNTLVLNDFADQFGSLIDLVWWPNLRLGNWKRYETALARAMESEGKSYDIIAGVSAVASAPVFATCATNFTLTDLVDDRNNKIPLYIWNYLRSTSNSSDEIVIIGVNSPFYEFYPENDIVFCQDKCKEISWLKKLSSTFRYSALGIMFCCSSEDVKLSQRLDGFPQLEMDTEPLVNYTATINPILEK